MSSDINPKALELAHSNAQMHGVLEQIEFAQGDLFKALSSLDEYARDRKRFDIIVANPPYVATEQIKQLPADVCKEPVEALDGGFDGLDFYRKIISQAKSYLKKGGYIAFEFGDMQARSIEQILKASALFEELNFFADLNGIYRFVIARRING